MRLRVLHLISTLDPAAGGPAESVRLLLEGDPNEYTGEVVCMDAPNSSFLKFPFPVHALGPVSSVYSYTGRLVPWLHKNLHRFDLIIVNGLWQYNGVAALRAVAGRKPYFVFSHGMLDPYFKRRFPLKHLKKWLYWVLVEYWVLRRADRVLFTSPAEAELAKESFWLHHWNPLVVPYGCAAPPPETPAHAQAFFERCPEARGHRFLLHLGRIHPKKGCDMLIDAFARVAASDPDLHLVMAGPDQQGWVATLQETAGRLGIADRVHWPGMLKGDAKWGSLYTCEAFTLPSHQENFGIAVAEALACGKPTLISDKVNISDVVASDGAGLVETDTPEGTLALLRRWIALSPDARQQMCRLAVLTYKARFCMDRTLALILEEARSIYKRRGATTAITTAV